MTREEQIVEAANAYYSDTWDEHGGIAMVVGNHHHDVWFPSCATDDFFKAGAEWADSHPDLYSVMRKAIERERKYLIEKACKWLDENMEDYTEWFNKVKDEPALEEFIDKLRLVKK